MKRARTDANQAQIVEALRSIGASVQPLHTVGQGVPDLLAGIHGRTFLIEVKDGTKPPSQRALTPDQKLWHEAWRGEPVWVVTDISGAIEAASLSKAEAG